MNDENIITSLSRRRERARVRPKVALWPVDIIMALPHTIKHTPPGGGIKRFFFLKKRKVIYSSAWTRVMIVTSGGARKRMGGPQVPLPLLT